MRIHFEILKLKRYNSLRDLGNYLIVATHKWSSDFGQNIWRPLFFLFSFHLLWHNLLLIAQFDVYPNLVQVDWQITKDAFNSYFKTLLPTHGADLTIDGLRKDIGGWTDFMMRVSSGYFMFYFVFSSRKYHQ
jgi:hypothetical protein